MIELLLDHELNVLLTIKDFWKYIMKTILMMRVVACVAVMVVAVGQVQADIVFYADRTSFEADITINNLIDFESLSGGRQDNPLVIGDASFFSTNDSGLFRTTGFDAPTVYLAAANSGGIQIDIAPGTNAIGTNVGALIGPNPFTYDLEDAFGTVASGDFTGADDNSTFIGWTSDIGDLRRLTITGSGFEAIDNFTLGTRAVPEPSSMAMFGLAGTVGFLARRRRRI